MRPPFLLWQPCSGDLIDRDDNNGNESGDDSNSNSVSNDDSDGNCDINGDSNDNDNLSAIISRMTTHSSRRTRVMAPDQLGNNGTLPPNGQKLRSIGLEVAGFKKNRQRVSERTNNERFSASYGGSAKTLQAVLMDLLKKDPKLSK